MSDAKIVNLFRDKDNAVEPELDLATPTQPLPPLPPPSTDIQFDESQQRAIAAGCDMSLRIVAITGPAGTGKTMIMKEIARQLMAAGYSVQASAPTGKAANRILQSTGLQAMTNHRMLGYGMPIEHEYEDEVTGDKKLVEISTGPKYNAKNPLPFDVLLCDEYAMVNRTIHSELIYAMKKGARMVMFGDVNQLKPIEEDEHWNDAAKNRPSPFQLALTKFGGIELKTIHRTVEGSGIALNGINILKGAFPRKTHDFAMVVTNYPVRELTEFVLEQLDKGIDYSKLDAQIITGMNKSWIGTSKLNPVIQSIFWDRVEPDVYLPRSKFRKSSVKGKKDEPAPPIRVQKGTKVVFTANVYDLGDGTSVFNGEVGIVEHIDTELDTVAINFGDRVVVIPPLVIQQREGRDAVEFDPRTAIDLAYVLTTHKVQGSEYKHVCVVMNKSTQWVQSRRNLYTAVSRAREVCTLITDAVSLNRSLKVLG